MDRAGVPLSHASSKHPCSVRLPVVTAGPLTSSPGHPCLVRLPVVTAGSPDLQPRAHWHRVQRCRTAEHPRLSWSLVSKHQGLSVKGHLSHGWWLPGTQAVLELTGSLSPYTEPGCVHRVQEEGLRVLCQQEAEGLPEAWVYSMPSSLSLAIYKTERQGQSLNSGFSGKWDWESPALRALSAIKWQPKCSE